MHTKNIFLIILFFFHDAYSHSLPNFVQAAKNFVKKSIKNIDKKELPSNLRYVMQLFRMYCVVGFLWQFLSSLKTIKFLLGSQKTEKIGLFLLKNRYKKFNEFNNTCLKLSVIPCQFFLKNIVDLDDRPFAHMGAHILNCLWIGITLVGEINDDMLGTMPIIYIIKVIFASIFTFTHEILEENTPKDLSFIYLTHLPFNKLEPIIPLLYKDHYFQKNLDNEDFFIDYDKTSAFLGTCLENEKDNYIKELFSYIVKNSGSPEGHIQKTCKQFIKMAQIKKNFSLQQLLIFLENISLQFPEYKILELRKLLFENIDFSNDAEINKVKEFSNFISKEQQESLFEIIKNKLVNESKKTDDYSSEKVKKVQELLKYFIETHKLPFERIIVNGLKNLRPKNILSLNQNLKIYYQNKDISNELFYYWADYNVRTEINFFKENVDYMLSLGMNINQFDKNGRTVLDILRLTYADTPKIDQNIKYLTDKGAKSFFHFLREYIASKNYRAAENLIVVYKKNNSSTIEAIAQEILNKNPKITSMDFVNFLFNGIDRCCNYQQTNLCCNLFKDIYTYATKCLSSDPLFANITSYTLWGKWFFALVNHVYEAQDESETFITHRSLKKFLEFKLPFDITIQNQEGQNAFHLLALSGKYECIETILQSYQPMIDADLIKKEKIKALFNQPMRVNNFNTNDTDPLNLARNQFTQLQEEKYQKTIDVIEKYLEN